MKSSFPKKLMVCAVVCAHLALVSCEKNPTEADSPKPSLPPASSLSTDLSAFNQALPKAGSEQVATKDNFITARTTVFFINTAVMVHMSVPVLTFAAAASQQPVLQGDGKWHWIYTVSNGGQQFQADLAGWIDASAQASRWEMRITTNIAGVQLNQFLWYTGTAALDNGSGQWIIYDHLQPNASVQVVTIDWDNDSASQASLKFTIVKPNVPENGDTLTYSTNASARAVVYFDQSANTTLTISWDAVTKEGYIIAPNYNSGNKACWDAQLNDITCP
ncbi:hypothetical protein DCC62_16455 [candidate division KSB1 bacterium]|nr:MAG: hypothetical protein DCC62_16455 [candidate division KSB1 bacterium]